MAALFVGRLLDFLPAVGWWGRSGALALDGCGMAIPPILFFLLVLWLVRRYPSLSPRNAGRSIRCALKAVDSAGNVYARRRGHRACPGLPFRKCPTHT